MNAKILVSCLRRVPSAFFLSFIATLPLCAQISDIFALFILGSGLYGGSSSMGILIVGRTIQGIGGGGIRLLAETIITDLVPLRERGLFIAVTMVAATVGAAARPFIGGLIANKSTWRWVFYINLPIDGASFILIPLCRKLLLVDVTGNLIFVGAIVAVLIALTWGSTVYNWNTYHIVVPLVLGFVGFGLFLSYEWTICKKPSFPLQVLSNRTSSAAFSLTLIHSLCTYWAFYFLPIYLQAVKSLSPFNSGINNLPVFAGIIPFAMSGGWVLSEWGLYKPLHLAGWAIITISYSLLSMLDEKSSKAVWARLQLLLAAGVWAFGRGFGSVWGVVIPSAVFNNECRLHAEKTIDDPQLLEYFTGGRAYEYITEAFLNTIGDPVLRQQVVSSLRTVRHVGVAFGGLGFLLTFVEREVEIGDKVDTNTD
ncbi:putative efflux pump antibiotic resistance protein [Daldinia sp. FL1419]|nr:putative efflux pump antibiotic resistance protein [Daldinia sp. FL1419]